MVEQRLQVAQHLGRAIGLHEDPLDEVGTRQVQVVLRDALRLVGEQIFGSLPQKALDIHASRLLAVALGLSDGRSAFELGEHTLEGRRDLRLASRRHDEIGHDFGAALRRSAAPKEPPADLPHDGDRVALLDACTPLSAAGTRRRAR